MVPCDHGKDCMEQQADANRQKHVLVVDDNVELAQTLQKVFQSHGYNASVASNGVQALKFVMRREKEVDAILCDLSMPQLEGDMFYATVQRVRPALTRRFIFLTGNAENPKYEPFLKNVDCPVLCKPLATDSLLGALRNLFAVPAGD
jgi:CheY-like chemotaxis protein